MENNRNRKDRLVLASSRLKNKKEKKKNNGNLERV
jgi:hypothetical protein